MISGRTTDTNFPVVNAFQKKYSGGTDGFIAKVVDTSGATVADPSGFARAYLHSIRADRAHPGLTIGFGDRP